MARARGLSSEEAEKFLHITIQPEKDVVLILTAAAQKQSIMKAICNEAFAVRANAASRSACLSAM